MTRPNHETNGFAIAALVLGLLAIAPLAVIFGFVALHQIKRDGGGGRGLAISGIVLSAVWTVLAVTVVVVIVSSVVGRDGTGRITEGGLINETDLRAGDCLNDPVEDKLALDAVPCDAPHDAEVFARFEITGSEFLGRANIRRRANAGCRHRLQDQYPTRAAKLADDISYFSPDSVDWDFGDRDVHCFANFDPKRRGSLEPR